MKNISDQRNHHIDHHIEETTQTVGSAQNTQHVAPRSPEDQLLDAMEGIRSDYLANAAAAREAINARQNGAGESKEKTISLESRRHSRRFGSMLGKVAAAVIAVSILIPNVSPEAAYAMQKLPVLGAYFRLVTFRNYQYEDAKHSADVKVSGIEVDPVVTDAAVKSQAAKSAGEINKQIQSTTDQLITDFKASLQQDGYGDLTVSTDVVTDSDRWYAIRLSAFVSQADGYQENRYYVIRKRDGQKVMLKDLFKDGADYQQVISAEIIRQMKEQMEQDDSKSYFINDPDIPDANFQEIKADQQFYINKDNQLVIAFQEGEVAPMYMGTQEFVIPDEDIRDILAEAL
jgi:hypothetical protein